MTTKQMPWMLIAAALCMSLSLTACGGDDEESGTSDDVEDAGTTGGGETTDAGGNVPVGQLRVAAIDELTGQPVLGAKVIAGIDGESGTMELAQQADGRYVAALEGDALVSVSVFHEDYHYVTVAGAQGHDLVVALRRLPSAKRGGLTGAITTWPVDDAGSIAVGVAGLAFQGNLLDFERALFRGEAREANFALPSAITSISDKIPATFNFTAPGAVMIGDKPDYGTFGLPAQCADEANEKAGTCGDLAAFSIYANVSTSDLLTLVLNNMQTINSIISAATSGEGVDIAALLPNLLPLLPQVIGLMKFDYARDLAISFGGDDQALTEHDFTPEAEFNLSRQVTIAALPTLSGKEPADLLGVGVLADLGTQGMIPLGVGVATAAGAVDVSMANAGTALNSASKKLLALAVDTDVFGDIGDATKEKSFSVIMENVDSLPIGGKTMTGSFLGAPTGSTFDPATRTISALPTVAGANLYRVNLKGEDRRWAVYVGEGAASVTLPAVPDGFDEVITADQGHTMIAIGLDGLTFDQLFSDNATNADQLGDLMTAFSISIR